MVKDDYTLLQIDLDVVAELSGHMFGGERTLLLNRGACARVDCFVQGEPDQKIQWLSRFDKPIRQLGKTLNDCNGSKGAAIDCVNLFRNAVFSKNHCKLCLCGF